MSPEEKTKASIRSRGANWTEVEETKILIEVLS